jgi:hypothetical protein
VSESTTVAETDAPPIESPPSERPATEPPATEPPATEPPATEPPAAPPPAADAPAESSWAGPSAEVPVTTTPPADAAPPTPPEQPPPPVPAAPAAKPSRRSVAVPTWLFGVLAIAVLVVGAFFVGRETAPETSGPTTLAEAVEETASGGMPVGDFNVQELIGALQQNGNLNLNLQDILDLLGGNR